MALENSRTVSDPLNSDNFKVVSLLQGSKCPSLPGLIHWVNLGWVLSLILEKWEILGNKISELCKFVNIEASKTS